MLLVMIMKAAMAVMMMMMMMMMMIMMTVVVVVGMMTTITATTKLNAIFVDWIQLLLGLNITITILHHACSCHMSLQPAELLSTSDIPNSVCICLS